MTTYTLSRCTVLDGPELSANNIPAFWENPNWVLTWKHRTLEFHISEVTKRFPRNLLNERTIKRHQKATDPETGRIVGYARWYLPDSYTTNPDGTLTWLEAVVPAVLPEEEADIHMIASTAIWDPKDFPIENPDLVAVTKKEILARKPYMRLDYLAVHPDNQRKGIGITLVQSGMKEAEKLGLDIFILALEAGMDLYKRLGFYIEKEIVQDYSKHGGTGEYRFYFMIYEQKPKSS